jgi:Lhr-like helicase
MVRQAQTNMLDDKVDKIISIQTETLNQIKRMNDVYEIRLQMYEKELEKMWKAVQDGVKARKEILLRLEQAEKTCIANHAKEFFVNASEHRNSHEGMIESWLGKKLYSGFGVVLTTLITAAVGIYVGILIR